MTDYEKEYIVTLTIHTDGIGGNGEEKEDETSVDAMTETEALSTAADVFQEAHPDMDMETIRNNLTVDRWNYTEESINKILDLKGANGELIDVFELYGVLFIGNTKGGTWDLSTDGRFSRHRTDHINLDLEDFMYCHTEEQVNDTFNERLREIIVKELV
jgi:hypothetical protein